MTMNLPTIIIGGSAVTYGSLTLLLTVIKPVKLKALRILKERFGESAGLTIHLIGYSLIPLTFGILAFYKAAKGSPIF